MSLIAIFWMTIFTIGAFTVFWVFFYQLMRSLSIQVTTKPVYYKNLLFAHRLLGFLLFGPVAGYFAYELLPDHWDQWGLVISQPQLTITWAIGLLLILIPANAYIARTTVNQAAYPQVRYQAWTPALFGLNALTWLLYLLGYEFLFRSLLFFPAIEVMGLWSAIGLNVGLYAIVHAPKGWREVFGAVPFGVLLCLASYETGSFWIAFIAHGSQALVNEFFSIRANPEMRFKGGAAVPLQRKTRS